jgi:ABC-type sugar transport system ATPase subunit
MAGLKLRTLDMAYGGEQVLHQIDLEVADGEFLVLVGPSGCGKSTLLRCIAGLETPTGGEIEIGGRRVESLEPRDRDVAMVFQSYALYPHKTVRQNLSFALEIRKTPKEEISEAVISAAQMLGIEDLLDRLPRALSGGQRQRVAVGRAVVRRPSVFLFDEPLSNLDASLRTQLRLELKRLHRTLGTTMIYVTHDQVEAMTLADRIVVLDGGRIQQVDTPERIYTDPINRVVAGFIGTPGMSFLHQIERGVVIGVRPHHVLLGEGPLSADVEFVENVGFERFVHLRLGTDTLVARVTGEVPKLGAIQVSIAASLRFDPETGERR